MRRHGKFESRAGFAFHESLKFGQVCRGARPCPLTRPRLHRVALGPRTGERVREERNAREDDQENDTRHAIDYAASSLIAITGIDAVETSQHRRPHQALEHLATVFHLLGDERFDRVRRLIDLRIAG